MTVSASMFSRLATGTCSHHRPSAPRHGTVIRCDAQKPAGRTQSATDKGLAGLGDVLGPIGLTIGKVDTKVASTQQDADSGGRPTIERLVESAGVSMGPIALTFGSDTRNGSDAPSTSEQAGVPGLRSIASMSTEEWRAAYERDGHVDLWVEEEFNSGSRLVGGRSVHNGRAYGLHTGEGPSVGPVATHTVKIFNHYSDQVVEVEVPEDRYVLWEAEDQGLELPYACRMGCCTACAVKVVEGELYQPQALGISEELKQQGYALMCVGFPRSDCVLQTVEEDEVYDLQYATDPNAPSIERDDFALEFANMDE